MLGRSDAVVPRACDAAIAQAMTQPAAALASMRPWVRANGLMILPASDAADPPAVPDFATALERRTYRVPLTDVSRQIWLARVRPGAT